MKRRLKKRTLTDAKEILTSIINALDKVIKKESTFTQACRSEGLEPVYTKTLVLNYLGKCKAERMDLKELEDGFTDSCVIFYRAVFGDRTIESANLPLDYMETVQEAVKSSEFTDEERTTLVCHFGIGGEEQVPLETIGKRLGCSAERTRQYEVKALRKCRRSQIRDMLRFGLFEYQEIQKQEAVRKAKMQEECDARIAKIWEDHERQMGKIKEDGWESVAAEELSKVSIEELELKSGPFLLCRNEIKTLKDLFEISLKDLADMEGIGAKKLIEIIEKAESYTVNKFGLSYLECQRLCSREKGKKT